MNLITIVLRLISLPFFIGLTLMAVLRIWIVWIWNFIRFGGESIAYTKKVRPKTIYDVYMKIDKSTIDSKNNGPENEILKQISKIEQRHRTEIHNLQQSYRKQFEWLKINHPKAYEELTIWTKENI